jgi:hypothetical protein
MIDYGNCNGHFINRVLHNKNVEDSVVPIKLKQPFKLCPNITESCCELGDIEQMGLKILQDSKKIRALFLRIKEVQTLYYEDSEKIESILKQIYHQEFCMNYSPHTVVQFFKEFKKDYTKRTSIVNVFVNLLFKYQSGLVCSICDKNQNFLYSNDK